jgi:hypothetical protein
MESRVNLQRSTWFCRLSAAFVSGALAERLQYCCAFTEQASMQVRTPRADYMETSGFDKWRLPTWACYQACFIGLSAAGG